MSGWNKKWGRDKICPITQTRLRPGSNKDGDSHVITIKCGHRFYRKAILNWNKISDKCPVCRNEIKIEK